MSNANADAKMTDKKFVDVFGFVPRSMRIGWEVQQAAVKLRIEELAEQFRAAERAIGKTINDVSKSVDRSVLLTTIEELTKLNEIMTAAEREYYAARELAEKGGFKLN